MMIWETQLKFLFSLIYLFSTQIHSIIIQIYFTQLLLFFLLILDIFQRQLLRLSFFSCFLYFHMLRGIQNNFLFHFHIYTHFYWYCSFLFFLLKTQNFLKYPILLVFDMNKKTKQNKNFSNDWLENIIIIIKHHSSSWRSLCVFVTF